MINLKKLAVGINSLSNLRDIQNNKFSQEKCIIHLTKHKPSRQNEILMGGSLYWIINNRFSARQLIIGFEDLIRFDGKKVCKIILKNQLIDVENIIHRPFQGWRYLKNQDSPNDIQKKEIHSYLPLDLNNHLSEFGFKI